MQVALSDGVQPADLDLQYKLYRVAAVVQQPGYDAYTFAATTAFASLESEVDALSANATAAGYKALAQSASALLVNAAEEGSPVAADYDVAATSAQSVQPGLYLLVAYGADAVEGNTPATNVLVPNESTEADASRYVSSAFSDTKRYDFAPEIVALPTKTPGANGEPANTADPSDWVYDATFTLKPTITDRVGALEISKRLSQFEQTEGVAGNEATFVFEIKGYATRTDAILAQTDPSVQPVYSNVASITFGAAGTGKVVVDNIPAGIYVMVTEVYSGTSYAPVGTQPQEGYIVATDNLAVEVAPTSVAFENVYNGSPNKGGSVTNSFEVAEGGEWVWSKDGEPQNGGQQGGER